jgi:NHL repeat-containing protein
MKTGIKGPKSCSLFLATIVTVCSVTGVNAEQYTWSTIAGVAGSGNSGWVDGTNADVRFNEPSGITIDGAGNFYIADTYNDRIRKMVHIGQDWVVSTIAGTNTAGSADGTNNQAQFNFPVGVASDTAGNLYVADYGNNDIRKITPFGTNWVTTTLNRIGTFFGVDAVAVDNAANVYLTEGGGNDVREMSFNGGQWVLTTLAGKFATSGSVDGTNGDARFYVPSGIARDPQGNMYVADAYNNTIRQLAQFGTNWVVTTIAGLARSTNGPVDGTNSDARFVTPSGVAIDSVGNLYVAEFRSIRRMVHIGTNWVVTTIGGLGATGIQANVSFYNANALLVAGSGDVYVTDTWNHAIRLGQPTYPLQASIAANQLELSWPVAASNFVLETSGGLSPGLWTTVSAAFGITNQSFIFITNLETTAAFFRLRKQQ